MSSRHDRVKKEGVHERASCRVESQEKTPAPPREIRNNPQKILACLRLIFRRFPVLPEK